MKEITINSNDAGRRFDRFLRKYLQNASLGQIYKIIRKDAKVNSKRQHEDYMLCEGDMITLYLSDEEFDKLIARNKTSRSRAKRQFKIIYEDEDILVVDKPFGLLTHGDIHEKKNHLANQVRDYLIETGAFDPREKVFSPAPANRIDRNTTGLVIFGKNATSLKELNRKIRDNEVKKYYLTVVEGSIDETLSLEGKLSKDKTKNRVTINDSGDLDIKTIVKPIQKLERNTTLVEVELLTGRSHQIRAHLSSIGHPIIGDTKYGGKEIFNISTQLLHAYKLEFDGRKFTAELPDNFYNILEKLGGYNERDLFNTCRI